MSGIYHEWNGTVLTITSDSGTSSADLKGDDGCRGPQGPGGGQYFPEKGKDYMTPEEIEEIAETAASMVSQPMDEMREEINSINGALDALDEEKTTPADVENIVKTKVRNVNILDNWDFRNPINQRGATSYSAETFCIDRWYFEQWSNTNPLLTINDGYITLSCTDAKGDTNTNCIKQTIEKQGLYSGLQVTFSVEFKNVVNNGDALIMIRHVGASGTKVASKILSASDSNSIVSVTTTLQDALTSLMVVIGNYANNGGDGNHTLEIVRAKLEVGNTSTLAYDPPAKYQDELRKCQRYYVRYSASSQTQFAGGATNGTTAYATVYLPTELYGGVSPTVSSANVNIYPYLSGASIEASGSVGGYSVSSRNAFTLTLGHASNANLPAQTPCNIRLGAGGYVAISAEL